MWSITIKRVLIAGGAALVLGAATIGLVLAQSPTPPPAPGQGVPARGAGHHEAFLEAVARRLGITVERLQQAINEARQEVGIPNRGERGERRSRGPEGEGRPRLGDVVGGGLAEAARAIGITVEQLRQELPGKSLAQVAQAHGKNPNDVATALKNQANQRIDQAVTNGRLPADRANHLKERLAQAIDGLMNRVVPERPAGASRASGPPTFRAPVPGT